MPDVARRVNGGCEFPAVIAVPAPALHDAAMPDAARWPALPYAAWKDTAATLQLWTQVVGKVRLVLTP